MRLNIAVAAAFVGQGLSLAVPPTVGDANLTVLEKRQGCKKVALIFARGSTEIGTMGSIVGPSFTSALGRKFGAGNVYSAGVQYPASIEGAISGAMNPGGAQGAIRMASMAKYDSKIGSISDGMKLTIVD
jgi:hypothetical protein